MAPHFGVFGAHSVGGEMPGRLKMTKSLRPKKQKQRRRQRTKGHKRCCYNNETKMNHSEVGVPAVLTAWLVVGWLWQNDSNRQPHVIAEST